jgi:hypothetical protein
MAEEKKPLFIQIDNQTREMTPEEVAQYEESIIGSKPLGISDSD